MANRMSTNSDQARSGRRKLEVKPGDHGGWEVQWAGSNDALFSEQTEAGAEDKAIDYLARRGGGHVTVHTSNALRVVTSVARLPSRTQILREGREICTALGIPFVTPEIAADFDVPDDDLDFAVALWHVCVEHPLFLSCETDFGVAYQYGPYVLLNRDSTRFTIEECRSTAAAMRRLSDVSGDNWHPRSWVPPPRAARPSLSRSAGRTPAPSRS